MSNGSSSIAPAKTLRSTLWALAAVAGVALCTAFALTYFPLAFPSVPLDIQMNRLQALERGAELAERFDWGPENPRRAASFTGEGDVQIFVELEGGGPAVFRELVESDFFEPYTWRVRLFREGDANEVTIRFAPSGDAYGFHETIPEDRPGAALAEEEARSLAETWAVENFAVDLQAYEPLEVVRSVRPSGRVDYSFAYGREGVDLGEGELRLWLSVAGNRVNTLTHYVKIPEAFNRRYAQMRSRNDLLSLGGTAGLGLFLVFGGLAGLLYLLRDNSLVWRPGVVAGVAVAFLVLLADLSELPRTWMNYDTAVPVDVFAAQFVIARLQTFVVWSIVMSLTFTVAEGLTRRAFPEQILFWQVFSPAALRSRPVRSWTFAAYGLVAVFFAYEVALYWYSPQAWGWWLPMDQGESPNILANYLPWLSPIAGALEAGFWEECLFRGIPIGAAALLGERWGVRRPLVTAAVIGQAVVFGLSHAGYAAQPAYARVVELILPALGFAWLYLRFGLLPGILLHFAYDVVWMALPLLTSKSAGVGFDQFAVVALSLLPFWLLLAAWWRGRRADPDAAVTSSAPLSTSGIPQELLNRNYRATELPLQSPSAEAPVLAWTPTMTRSCLALGVLGLLVWGALTRFEWGQPAIRIERAEVLERARDQLARQGVELDASWQTLAWTVGAFTRDARFVWQTDREAFDRLLGSYLDAPHWNVRNARFEGDVAERAEEYGVTLSGTGEILRTWHVIPEHREGVRLREDAARAIAIDALRSRLSMDPAALEEMSARRSHLPNRDDWSFVFADRVAWPHPEGEARTHIKIAGDEVTDGSRYMKLPEDWLRADRHRRARLQVVHLAARPVSVLLMICGVMAAVVSWSRGRFLQNLYLSLVALTVTCAVLGGWNGWPRSVASFATSQAWAGQVTQLVWGYASTVAAGTGMLLIAGLPLALGERRGTHLSPAIAVAMGALFAGADALRSWVWALVSPPPDWGMYSAAASRFPWISEAIVMLREYVLGVILILAAFVAIDWLSTRFTRQRLASSVVFVAGMTLLYGGQSFNTAPSLLLAGLWMAVLSLASYVFVFRHDLSLLPLFLSVSYAIGKIADGVAVSHPGSVLGTAVGAIAVLALGARWMALQREGWGAVAEGGNVRV